MTFWSRPVISRPKTKVKTLNLKTKAFDLNYLNKAFSRKIKIHEFKSQHQD